ncbi:MAG: hypothetical protein K9J25_06945 [Bacteroidales bacterium]|nr:hypothetical protein [Bacteroidales bacterium]
MNSLLKLILIILLIFPSVLKAQDDFKGFSVNPRIGAGYPFKYDSGITGSLEVCFFRGQNIYSAGYSNFTEFVLFGEEDYVTNNINLLYGRFWGSHWYRYQVQGGLAPLWGQRRLSDYHSRFFSVGLVLRTGIKLFPTKFAAISADCNLNLNPEVPNVIIMFGIDLGKLMRAEKKGD